MHGLQQFTPNQQSSGSVGRGICWLVSYSWMLWSDHAHARMSAIHVDGFLGVSCGDDCTNVAIICHAMCELMLASPIYPCKIRMYGKQRKQQFPADTRAFALLQFIVMVGCVEVSFCTSPFGVCACCGV